MWEKGLAIGDRHWQEAGVTPLDRNAAIKKMRELFVSQLTAMKRDRIVVALTAPVAAVVMLGGPLLYLLSKNIFDAEGYLALIQFAAVASFLPTLINFVLLVKVRHSTAALVLVFLLSSVVFAWVLYAWDTPVREGSAPLGVELLLLALVGFISVGLSFLIIQLSVLLEEGRRIKRDARSEAAFRLLRALAEVGEYRNHSDHREHGTRQAWDMIWLLERAADIISFQWPKASRLNGLGHGLNSIYTEHCRRMGSTVREMALWLLLPKRDTHHQVAARLSSILLAIVLDRIDEIPLGSHREARGEWRRLAFSKGLGVLIGFIPIGVVVVVNLLGVEVEGIPRDVFIIFAAAWAFVNIAFIDPSYGAKLDATKDILDIFKP